MVGVPAMGPPKLGLPVAFLLHGAGHGGFLLAVANSALQDAGLGLKSFFPVTQPRVMAGTGWAVPRCRAERG